MNRIDTDAKITTTDREIKRRFAQIRARDAESAPAFNPQSPLVTHQRPEHWHSASTLLPRLAAAIVVVAAAVALLSETQPQDPAELYAEIMKNEPLQTDSLLIVSASVLPAMNAVPRLYDMQSAFATEADRL